MAKKKDIEHSETNIENVEVSEEINISEEEIVKDIKGAEKTTPEEVDAVAAKVEKAKKKTAPKRKRKETVVVDAETRDVRALLKGARAKFTIMKGVLERVDVVDNAPTPEAAIYGVVHYRNFKIMIPALYMNVEVPGDVQGREKAAVLRKNLNTMLGSNIEYVITSVSESDNLAVGNREIAMSIKRKQYFVNKYRNTGKSYIEYAIEKKVPVDADIIAVSGSQIRLAVCGAEAKVLARDASWRFSSNLSENFFPGDSIKVIIKEVVHNEEKDTYSLKASIRETMPNAQVNNIADYSINSTCLGKVSGAINTGYFIAIGDNKTGIEAFCDLVHGGVTPMIGDIVSCQLTKIDYESGQAKAKITRIIRRAKD